MWPDEESGEEVTKEKLQESQGRFLKAYILLARTSVIWPQWAARDAGKCSLYFTSRGERDHTY